MDLAVGLAAGSFFGYKHRTNGAGEEMLFRNDKLTLRLFKDFFQRSDYADIGRHSAGEDNRLDKLSVAARSHLRLLASARHNPAMMSQFGVACCWR